MIKILCLGSSGLIGSDFVNTLVSDFELLTPLHDELDITDQAKLMNYLEKNDFQIIINFVGFTNVEGAEEQKGDTQGMAFVLNSALPDTLAKHCAKSNKKLLHISTEYIFNGRKDTFYTENDKGQAINWYGQTKLYGEQYIIESGCKYLIIRISMPYTAFYEKKKDSARFFMEQLKNNNQLTIITDQKITPTFIPTITHALKVLIDNDADGIYHIASTDPLTPYDFAVLIAEEFGFDKSLISTTTLEEYNSKKKAPLLKNSALDTTKFTTQFGDKVLYSNRESIKLFKQKIDALGKD